MRRRTLLGAGSTAALALAALRTGPVSAAETDRPQVALANMFKVVIEGCTRSSPLCVSVDFAPVRAVALAQTPRSGPAPGQPGPLLPGTVRLRFVTPAQGGNADLVAWMAAAAKGVRDLRLIIVTLLAADQKVIRTFHLTDCFPTQFDSGDFSTGGEANVAELVVQPTRVEPA